MEYAGLPCNKFVQEVVIDRNKALNKGYSGNVTENGYPIIETSFCWKICNDNPNENEYIKLKSDKTFAKLRNAKLHGLNTGGVMRAGKCRIFERQEVMNTEKR